MFLIFVPSIMMMLIYALDPTMSKPLKPELAEASFYVYALYAVLYYILLVFDHLVPPQIDVHLKQSADELMGKYEQTRERK